MEKLTETVIQKINGLLQSKPRIIVAIDGRCAAGKTTLAARLGESLSCNVIHMDEFFLRPEQRTPQRLKEPGGNVDYERFLEEVLPMLKKSRDFAYMPFDCKRRAFGEAIEIKANAVNIVEGSCSCHPALREHYDLKIFLSVSPEKQLERILRRNGEADAEAFKNRWIPLEESYFMSFGVEGYCDMQFTT